MDTIRQPANQSADEDISARFARMIEYDLGIASKMEGPSIELTGIFIQTLAIIDNSRLISLQKFCPYFFDRKNNYHAVLCAGLDENKGHLNYCNCYILGGVIQDAVGWNNKLGVSGIPVAVIKKNSNNEHYIEFSSVGKEDNKDCGFTKILRYIPCNERLEKKIKG